MIVTENLVVVKGFEGRSKKKYRVRTIRLAGIAPL